MNILSPSDTVQFRMKGLDALHKLTAYNRETGPPIVQSQIVAELNRPASMQSREIQSGLANCSMFYGGGIMRSLLQNLADKSPFEDVKKNSASMVQLSEMAELRKKKAG